MIQVAVESLQRGTILPTGLGQPFVNPPLRDLLDCIHSGKGLFSSKSQYSADVLRAGAEQILGQLLHLLIVAWVADGYLIRPCP